MRNNVLYDDLALLLRYMCDWTKYKKKMQFSTSVSLKKYLCVTNWDKNLINVVFISI